MLKKSLRVAALLAGLLACSAHAASFVDVKKAATAATEPVEKAFYQDLSTMQQRLGKVSGLELRLLVSDEDDVNAYATEDNGERLVVLNWGLLEALHEDRDGIAAVLAHEYAHHAKNHIGKSKTTSGVLGVLGALAGAAINAKLGSSDLGQRITGVGAQALSSTFSRDQEREADTQGLQWMVAAGYNPQGAVRMQKKLMEMAGSDDKFSLFRSHPPSKERAADLEKLIGQNPAATALLNQPLVALTLPVAEEEDASPAPGQGTQAIALAEPAPASLLPVQGFTLERYARFVNELAASEESQYPKLYAKYQLTVASTQQLNATWAQRMQADPALAVLYGVVFLETAVGPFAQHARDVAQAQRSGVPVAGDSPIPQSDWLALLKKQATLQKSNPATAAKQFAEATRAKGYSPYDFNLASQWWFAVARQQAERGNTALMTQAAASL